MTPRPLDLDPDSRRSLELDALLGEVAAFACTAAGAAQVRALAPSADLAVADLAQAAVEEARRFLAREGRLVPSGLPDPAPALLSLRVEGVRGEPKALRDLATVLLGVSELRTQLLKLEQDTAPRLRELGDRLPDLRREVKAVVDHVGPDGEIQDEASPELKRLRSALYRSRERLRRQLESFLHDPAGESVIRDDFVTQRSGRFVIPVRADSPRALPGIVHAASSSGATLFVEPLESVEGNNELVRLAEAERTEIDRILDGWTQALRLRRPEVLSAVEGIAEADSLQARASFADRSEASRPRFTPGAPLRLVDARHPMLDRRLREEGGRSVPLTVELSPPHQVLVLSGPNTGGKTVALKTMGLAALMAQSGIPVLAREAELPVFRQVRADIGDHQSVESDLSTFSAHVRAVGRFLREVAPPALFLFDEIGTGTEPTEGAALAQAILEELKRAGGVTAVATTHLGTLKAWAFTTEGAESAAMEFDTETLQPTYRIQMGAAGASAGIDIAGRLGIAGAIVDRARELIGPGARQVETTLAILRERMADVVARQEEQRQTGEALAEEKRRQEETAIASLERHRTDAARALAEALHEFRDQARREIAGIKDKKEQARVERERARSEQRMGARLKSASERIAGPSGETPAAGPIDPRPGQRVLIRSLEREGEILEIRGTKVEVRMGSATFTVALSDLAAPDATKTPPVSSSIRSSVRGPQRPAREVEDDVAAPPFELMLLGKTVDEALSELDRALDRAARSGMPSIRVVHGHGTGRLKAAVRKFLRGHAHVAEQRPGEPREGGDGATVVTLR